MILAEEILLLLTDDATGKSVVDSSRLDIVLSGAVLLELAMAGRVDVAGPGEPARKGHLVVRDSTPLGDPVLDEALRRIVAAGPKKPESVIPVLSKQLRTEVLSRLISRGILKYEQGRVLGIFPTHSWPALDSTHENQLRAGLHSVLIIGRTPSDREAAIISLLNAVDGLPKVLGTHEVNGAELRRRAKIVATSSLGDTAVRRAIQAMDTATMTAIMTASMISSSSSN